MLTGLSGLVFIRTLKYVNQTWIQTYHNTLTYLLLPTIGFVITSSISNNIALSLGMIGALSIVRFRHPVKSPFELVMFFALLTVGVTMTVNTLLSCYLVLFITVVLIIVKLYTQRQLNLGRSAFRLSFDDGEKLFILELSANSEIESINENQDLIYTSYNKFEGIYNYKFAFTTREQIDTFHNQIKNSQNIINIEKIYN